MQMDGDSIQGNRLVHAASLANGMDVKITHLTISEWNESVKFKYKLRDSQFETTLLHVLEGAKLNKLRQTLAKASLTDDAEEAFSIIEADKDQILSIAADRKSETEEALTEIRAKRQRIKDGEKRQIAAVHAVPGIERCFGYIQAHEMITVAARTSIGKTAYAVQWARANLEQGKRVAYLSSEMPISIIFRAHGMS